MEPDDFYTAMHALGGKLTSALQVDIPSRFAVNWADDQARHFTRHMLNLFEGLAQDDFSNHFWTVEEIERNTTYDGLRFNDIQAWYEKPD